MQPPQEVHAYRPANPRDVIDILNGLIEIDFDLLAAYEVAVARMDSARYRAQLEQFIDDHKRHTRKLSDTVRDLGGSPAGGSNFKALITKGKVVVGDIVGDRGILLAMQSNAEDAISAYERALESNDHPPYVRRLLEDSLMDERRHRAWMVERIEQPV